jgi:starch synthase
MEILHVSAECFPYAKAGGLGDVAGALPKYQQQAGHVAKLVMPMHKTKFLYENDWEVVHKSSLRIAGAYYDYTIIKEATNKLGFDLYAVDVYGLTDREKVYGYDDDSYRYTVFQIAIVHWLAMWEHRPDVVHVHDHTAALVPFMMKHCYEFKHLENIKTVLTIHNAQYQGWMPWANQSWLPAYDSYRWGLLDWNDMINPLACAVKTCERVTTVSQGYLEEILVNANGLEALFEYERGKCVGIINGIDDRYWNTETDTYLEANYTVETMAEGKRKNKEHLCSSFGLDVEKPLFIFIGRLVGEKAADILPAAIQRSIYETNGAINILVLGSGDPNVEHQLTQLNFSLQGYYNSRIAYHEKLSHIMYAAADFLLMPSRVEPCGLNQMYAMRYGTIPIVRSVGGLRDTVIDLGNAGGYGLTFNHATVDDLVQAMHRACGIYYDQRAEFDALKQKVMQLDFSWENSIKKYLEVYMQ